jgi:D-alanyl-lipoteichoic acid acyltransferase DltB (MBOAT superfamily)
MNPTTPSPISYRSRESSLHCLARVLFNSGLFLLLFFPVVTLLYHALPHGRRWFLLLVASCYFYMVAVPAYLGILATIIVIDYIAGLAIERAAGARRRAFLLASIGSNLALLAVFKYAGFAAENATRLAQVIGWNYAPEALSFALPIGLSFHTFQSMAYTIEVYRGHQPAERHAGYFALYVMFYPQLVAGPIERPQHLLPQLRRPPELSAASLQGRWRGLTDPCVGEGLQLMIVGFFKKLVIADRVAVVVDNVYATPQGYAGVPLIVATACFAVQIYCDFSGYTDIARGAALTMGVRLTDNFAHPYGARSIADFWRRWHISLSSWFRDYVYVPLGGNRVSTARWVRNVLVTFLLSGLWHGANWTFVVWGALHGVYLVAGRALAPVRARAIARLGLLHVPRFHATLRAMTTFGLVAFAWIAFRAESLSDAWFIATHLTTGVSSSLQSLLSPSGEGVMVRLGLAPIPVAKHEWLLIAVLVGGVILLDLRRPNRRFVDDLLAQPIWARWAVCYALVCGVLFFGVYRSATFIYFQF